MKIPMQEFVSGYPNDQENSNIEHFTSQKCKIVRPETTFEFVKKSSRFFYYAVVCFIFFLSEFD
jgi:hypothetical protein